MATRDVAHINGIVAQWARERVGLTRETLAKSLGKGFTAETVLAWESGNAFPTLAQAENLAKKLRLPFGILFMPEPPSLTVPIPDLRTVSGQPPANPSINFFEIVNENQSRQSWYREAREREQARDLPFVGRFRIGAPVVGVAADIAQTLGITDDVRRECRTWEQFLTQLIQISEDAGIMIMRSAWAKHSWARGLDVEEFRGFALSDRLAPLIFVNGADAKAAQIFTLAHELAHIWIGASGISNPNPRTLPQQYENPIESYCNSVAAELLIPAASLNRLWKPSDSADVNTTRISVFHRVSKIAAAIRARDLGKISPNTASAIIDAEYDRFYAQRAQLKAEAKEREGGPGFWRGFTERVSGRFSDTVFSALDRGELLFRDAARLLGITLTTLDKHPARGGGHT